MRVLDAGRWMLSTDRIDCHPLSTMTRDSFHVYSWTFRSFVLILFHAYERSHRSRNPHDCPRGYWQAENPNMRLASIFLQAQPPAKPWPYESARLCFPSFVKKRCLLQIFNI